jgi:hypothetical protein
MFVMSGRRSYGRRRKDLRVRRELHEPGQRPGVVGLTVVDDDDVDFGRSMRLLNVVEILVEKMRVNRYR